MRWLLKKSGGNLLPELSRVSQACKIGGPADPISLEQQLQLRDVCNAIFLGMLKYSECEMNQRRQ